MKTYIDKKDVKVNKIYDVEYIWGDKWLKGWGRLTTVENGCGTVNVITADGGVSNVDNDYGIRFIKLTGVKQKSDVIVDQIKSLLKEKDVVLSYVLPKPVFLRGDTKIRIIGYGYIEVIQCGHSFDLSFDVLSDSVLQQILDSLLPEETKVIQLKR